ncbi:MAG: 23S rRNA (uracil(1939)-C(5))-methyltransferase RlmD [Bacillales bacterium]|nr:23S rRNA (uracil(1939)-C(5))-methyltransferase RlmD [Bacillales bacterium]
MAKEQAPVQLNEKIEVVFDDVTHEGQGVAKVDGYPLFVPGALQGEKGTIQVTKINKSYGFGKILDIYEESSERTNPPCPLYHECGGCQLQHVSYEGQLKIKEKHVQDCLVRIGKITDTEVLPVLGMETPWHYRNKAQVPVGERNGKLIAGFYKKRSHEIMEMDACIIQQKQTDETIQAVKDICARYHIRPYDEKQHKGILRHIMVRYGRTTGEIMVVLITRTKDLPHKKKIVQEIIERVPGVRSIIQNVNSNRTNVILGEETFVLWGRDVIYDSIGDVQFAISAKSFYQVNPEQTKVLYDKALEYAELKGDETVIDAYCGIGTISLFLAKKAKKVYGVEIVPEAIEDAKKNAERNGITNAEFAAGKAEEVIPEWYKRGIKADVLVVDPPRKGCDPALLDTILQMKPKKVVYVSCNPATLARDLRILEDGGYKTTKVQPVDMFPQTGHVEAVAQIVLRGN